MTTSLVATLQCIGCQHQWTVRENEVAPGDHPMCPHCLMPGIALKAHTSQTPTTAVTDETVDRAAVMQLFESEERKLRASLQRIGWDKAPNKAIDIFEQELHREKDCPMWASEHEHLAITAVWNGALAAAIAECERLEQKNKDDHRNSWMGNAIAALEALRLL